MSSEIEAAGAAVTAGLVGAAIDSRKGADGHGAAHGACTNCGTVLDGQYCPTCGQPAHIHRTILHMAEELLHGILHFDTRAWKTLPVLVFRPGTLTHDYIHGKRARFISPIALFLLTIFTMFFVFAVVGGAGIKFNPADSAAALESAQEDVTEAEQELTAAQKTLSERQAELAAIGADAEEEVRADALEAVGESENEVAAVQQTLDAAQAELTELKGLVVAFSATDETGESAAVEISSMDRLYERVSEAARSGEINVNTGFKSLDKKILHKLQNPELAVYKVQNTAYKFSFLLVPISLPFMWLLFFWKRGVTLFDHAVFVLYSLSFMSLMFIVGSLLSMISATALGAFFAVINFAVPLHMFFQLKGAYSLGWFSALWRTFFLLMFCVLAMGLFVIAIILLGLGG